MGHVAPAWALAFFNTPFLQRTVTSYTAEPTNPLSSVPNHQTHGSSRKPGGRDIAHFFPKASYNQTRTNMKDRRKGRGASGWVPGLSHRALSVTNEAVRAIAPIQLFKPRLAPRTFLGGKLCPRRRESWRVRLAPVSFLTGPWVGNVTFLTPGWMSSLLRARTSFLDISTISFLVLCPLPYYR